MTGIFKLFILPLRRLCAACIIIFTFFIFANLFGSISAFSAEIGLPDFVIPPDFDSTEPKTAYLTFDDGPSRNTARILDILREEDVTATFFVIKSSDADAESLMRRIVEEGHTIAPHAYVHDYSVLYRSLDSYIEDFARIGQYVYDVTGVRTRIFRFPGGSGNVTVSRSLRSSIQTEMTRRGYVYYDWNIVSGDDTPQVLSPETLAAGVMRQAGGKDTLVILFHDAPLYTTTPDAVRLVIRQLREEGYRFERITEATQPIQFNKQTFEAVD